MGSRGNVGMFCRTMSNLKQAGLESVLAGPLTAPVHDGKLVSDHLRLLILTSVPYLDNAAFACCRIFSLYIWAARLLYLALVSFVEQPCWRKNAVCGWKERGSFTSQQAARTTSLCQLEETSRFYFIAILRPEFLLWLTALALPPTCIHLSWNQFQLESNSVDLWGEEYESGQKTKWSSQEQKLQQSRVKSGSVSFSENLPDEAEMHAQGAVDAWAVNAQEHTVRDTCPAGIFGSAVKAYLSKNRMKSNYSNDRCTADVRVVSQHKNTDVQEMLCINSMWRENFLHLTLKQTDPFLIHTECYEHHILFLLFTVRAGVTACVKPFKVLIDAYLSFTHERLRTKWRVNEWNYLL